MNKTIRPGLLWPILICLTMATLACGGGKTGTLASNSASNTTTPTTGSSDVSIQVGVTPATSLINTGSTQQFSASVSGTTDTGVTWSVNGTQGGSSKVGTISGIGLYTAPSSVPSGGSVTITATSAADTTKSASASVNVRASSVSASGSSTATASGKAYYVSPSGNDSNPGTASAPFLTIQQAANVATAGYTVYVAPGTYNVSSTITSSSNGTSLAPIVFISTTQWGAKIVTTAAVGIYIGGSYTTFQNFDISASGTGTAGLLKLTGSAHDSAIGNRVHDMGASSCVSGAGIQVGTGGTGHVVFGNYIYNIGLAPGTCNQTHGVYVLTNSNTIQSNIIFHNGDLGIQIDGNGPSNNIVTNNTIFDNWRGIVIDTGDGGSNTAAGNIISNNIIYKNIGAGYYDGMDGSVSGNTISYNVIYGNSPNLSMTGDTSSNIIQSDPSFVNYTGDDTGNYELSGTSSPAYHAGTQTDAPAADFAGNAYSNPPSIGAYEYVP